MRPEPERPDSLRPDRTVTALRIAFGVLTALFAGGVVAQVFLAGMGVLVDPSYFGWHTTFAHILEVDLLLLIVVGALARVGWRDVGLALLLFALFTLQYVFLYALQGPARGLHAANALLLFWGALQLGRRTWWRLGAVSSTAADPPAASAPRGALARATPALSVMLVSVIGLAVIGFLTSTRGGPATVRAAAGAGASQITGRELYDRHCAACHGTGGGGGMGPALAGNGDLADTTFVADRIVHGAGGMPAWGERLDDERIAQVASYVRGAWGNDHGEVTPAEVAAVR